ncbi:hypothetical protein ACRVX5_16255 [Clostridioides difficile]|nr:hypothetical protein [Clostridioides difficile]MCL6901986.1 hypothetical protein [Clostridioides difficile]MCP3377834.1 hypothetical protein [Clostridioides difficile]MDE3493464.1 hypothetical protein [Clostridioides difficile]MDE3707885.1 hypothetical protein [Clostridioides difficile]
MILGGILVTLLCLLSIYNALCMHLGNVKNNEYSNENTIFKFEAKETGEKTVYKLK